MALEERLDFALRFVKRLSGHVRVVPRAEPARRLRPDQEPLLLGQIGQRELVGIQEPCGHGAPEPFGVLRVRLLRHGEIATEGRLDRSQDVSAAAARTQEEDIHVTPRGFLV